MLQMTNPDLCSGEGGGRRWRGWVPRDIIILVVVHVVIVDVVLVDVELVDVVLVAVTAVDSNRGHFVVFLIVLVVRRQL